MSDQTWPSCFYGPDGQAEVFACAAEVPKGWADHPSKVQAAADPFDHDGDGKPGGSLPAKSAPARRKVNRRGDRN